MREILFRGKTLISGRWIDGDLRQWSSGNVGICDRATNWTYKVDPDTVGQYTGLKDKDGKPIFEGDVVRWTKKDIYLAGGYVYYTSYGYGSLLVVTALKSGFTLRPIKDNAPETPNANGKIDNYAFWNNHHFLEVIGNIHDNPELMEGYNAAD